MSYCYDVTSTAWQRLRHQLPPEVRDSELAWRFEFLINEMHEANHRLKDGINRDYRVTQAARKLDNIKDTP